MSKNQATKDLITGIGITLLFGSGCIAGIVTTEDLFLIISFGLIALLGLVVISLSIWEFYLVKKDYAYTQVMKELNERKMKAEEELRKAQEEAKELSKLDQQRG